MSSWFVYILRCEGGTLYTGITNRMAIRLEAHLKGKGARYTRSHKPIALAYYEEGYNRSTAAKRERQVKAMSRGQKDKLIQTKPVKGPVYKWLKEGALWQKGDQIEYFEGSWRDIPESWVGPGYRYSLKDNNTLSRQKMRARRKLL